MEAFQGVILRQIAYKESSKILHVYTDQGLISFLAHGAKRLKSPFLSALDRFNYVQVFATGKDLKTLTDVTVVESFPVLKADLVKLTYLEHIAELVYHVQDSSIDHQKLAPFLYKIMQRVEREQQFIPYLYMFELKLLYLLGIQPALRECLVCKVKTDLVLSVEDGGLRCNHHLEHKEHWSTDLVDLLQTLYYYDLQNPQVILETLETTKEARLFLDQYYLYHLHYQTKSRHVLMGLLGY